MTGDDDREWTEATSDHPPRWDGTPALTEEIVTQQAAMLAQRVKKRLKHLHARFERQQVGVFRLYDWDIPEIRAVVDWYEGHLVIAEYARQKTDDFPGWLERLAGAVATALQVPDEHVHLKRRVATSGVRYDRARTDEHRMVVREGALRYYVDLDSYIDTGLFADHRPLRARLVAEGAGRRVLNLFAYTGSFTCAVVHGGATSSVTVDLSSRYLDWASDNLELNGLRAPQHELIASDSLTYLESAARHGTRFDLILVDPPSFSTRHGTTVRERAFDVERDHPELLHRTLALLEPGGTLYFSSNHQRFHPRFQGLPATEILDITHQTVPEDFRNRQAHRCYRMVGAARSSSYPTR